MFPLVLLCAACDSPSDPPLEISFDALVQVLVLEGPDTYLLRVLDSEQAYYPLNLPSEFQIECTRVHAEGLLIRDYQVLLHPPLEILSIGPLDD